MADKRYRIKTSCPQCGCSFATHLSAEEIKKRYGDVPNVEMECGAVHAQIRDPHGGSLPGMGPGVQINWNRKQTLKKGNSLP